MRKSKLFINMIVILMLVLTALGNTSLVAQAGKGNEELKADPRLLQMAADNPDATFMVIVQREVKNKDAQEDDPETDVEKEGGKVKKQFKFVESFSAELTGKQILKLAKKKKVRWISADALMVSATVGEESPVNPVVANAPLAAAKTFTVANTNNSGTGSLRQAITDANNNAGTDTIKFTISGTGVHTITPTSALPNITGAVLLDATTDDSFVANGNRPAIIVAGTNAGIGVDGLVLTSTADGSTIRGLLVRDWGADGISIRAGSDNNFIIGNYIGRINPDGTAGAAGTQNEGDGIYILGSNNTIGGTTAADRNVISGNDDGVTLDTGATGNVVIGNYIGTDATGTIAVGNTLNAGVWIKAGRNNRIGGADANEGNLIANNAGDGVFLQTGAGTGNSVLGNSLYSNGGIGIDLGTNGVTANNGTKSSSLPNYGMDYPVITATALGDGILNITGYVGSAASQGTFANARVEFFKSAADSSGYGEGQTFIGYLTTDSSGNFSGSLSGNGLTSSDFLTATATFSNNTSEFGPNLQVTGTPFSAFLPTIRADQLSLTGSGVTVAVIDSGIAADQPDFMVGNQIDAVVVNQTSFGQGGGFMDLQGHGTHVAGVIGGSGASSGGLYKGVAPNVNLVSLRVSDKNGMTYESSVIDSLQWVFDNKSLYNIKVVNLSLNSTVAQSYHTSPLDAAVEILWFNGIVVVVSAGNNGTDTGPVSIYPPANDPFVITVGAMEDKGTASLADDTLAIFSAYGTTEDGFAKPDLVAPGRNVIAPLSDKAATVYLAHPLHRVGDYYFRMSGTSMSAPVVTGAVALLLQDEPDLTPDQVKYRLMATTNTTWSGYNASQCWRGQPRYLCSCEWHQHGECQHGYGCQPNAFHRFNSYYLGQCRLELGWLEQRRLELGRLEFGGLEQCWLEFGRLEFIYLG